MTRIAAPALGILSLVVSIPTLAGTTATFETVPIPLAGYSNSKTSSDGTVTAINAGGHYYRAVEGVPGADDLGLGHSANWSVGVSGDGGTIMGTRVDPVTLLRNPAIWTEAGGWTLLGGVPGAANCDGSLGSGYDLNGDGTMGTGLGWLPDTCKATAFLWTAPDTMIRLERLPPWSARGSAISNDGSTVVGWANHPDHGYRVPARWVNGGSLDLFLGEDQRGEATNVNSDGSMICGTLNGEDGFIWSETGGLTVIPSPVGGEMYINDIAEDGTAVGWYGSLLAMIRLPDGSIHNLFIWLLQHGATIPPTYALASATSISDDGSTITGSWYEGSLVYGTFIARLTTPTGVGTVAGASSTELRGAFPNPFQSSTSVRFSLDRAQRAAVSVFDVTGRRVIELTDRRMSAGLHEVPWNGRDASGRPTAAGTYFVRLKTEGESRVTKVVRAK